MPTTAFKSCPSCRESVKSDFDFCPYCKYLFPKSTWQTNKNTIVITVLSGTVIFLGGLLLFGPSGSVPPAPLASIPSPSVTATVKPTPEPVVSKVETPKPVPTTAVQSKTPAPKSTPEVDLQIKGNRNSGIYHLPGCPNYDDIKDSNVIWFKTEEEAKAAGFRRARNC